jgi:uncharacterized protein (TIGR03435 family)
MRLTAVLALGTAVATLSAQPLSFDAATVKPNHTDADRRTFPGMRNGTFTAELASLRMLISLAYGLIEQRIEGPGWLDTERYDIVAKAPEGVPDSQMQPLLQALLRDRFHLRTHYEMKELPTFEIIVGNGGAKLQRFDPARPPQSPPNRGQAVLIGRGTTGELADTLVRSVGRPVIDRTGMSEQERFTWVLQFSPLLANGNSTAPAPDIFAAIEEQLGLKLQSTRSTLQILVVDSADRVPTEN